MIRIAGVLVVCLLMGFISCTDEPVVGDVPVVDTLAVDSSETEMVGLRSISERIKTDPNNANFYFERASFIMAASKRGENVSANHFTLAINDLKRSISIDSTVAVFHYELGNVYYQLGQSVDAMSEYQATIRHDDTHTEAMVKIAQIYLVYKNYPESIKYADMSLKVNEYTAEAYFVKGWAFKEMADTFKAASSFQTAREVNPEYYEADIQLAMLYSEANNDRAIQYYNSALSIQPKSIEALYGRGMYYQNKELLEEAQADYQSILAIDSTYPLAHFNLGYINLIYLADYETGAMHYTKAIASVPDYYEAMVNRGLCYEQLGRTSEAEQDYRLALQIKPDYDLAAEGLGRIGAQR